MAPSRPTSRRPGSGPGRGTRPRATPGRKPSPRGVGRASTTKRTPPARKPTVEEQQDQPESFLALARRRSGLTTRAIALGVVVLMLTISYASSLRIYLDQKHEIAATKAEIAQRTERITDLQTELTRWEDPAYVKAQARSRLGWAVPGEVGYRVVDEAGNPIGAGHEIESDEPDLNEAGDSWWARAFGSIEAADHPAPGAEGGPPAEPEPTITPEPDEPN